MKLKNIAIYGLMLAATTTFVACDEWLSEEPSKSTQKTLKTTEQLDALLGNYSLFHQESVTPAYGTDDWGITPEFHTAKSGGVFNATTQLPYILYANEVDDSRYSVWQQEYPKIYYANMAIEQAMGLEGPEEDKANLKAEGHFLRAYSMFNLALAHTLYYTGSNGDELGLSLQTMTFEDSAARANLADTWAAIDADLQEALKITVKLQGKDGRRRVWRATTASVNAFAARYYLYRGDLTQAKTYAEKALAEYSTLADYNQTMSFSQTTASYVINTKTGTEEKVTVYYPSTYNNRLSSAANFGTWFDMDGFYLARDMYHASWWFVPSQDLVDTYAIDLPGGDSQNDLRFRYYFVEDFSLRTCSKDPAFHWWGVMAYEMEALDAGPSVAEMMLIKAECQARGGDYAAAMKTIAPLRKARIDTEVYTELTASSKDDAIKKVLQERRREMCFTMRWYDLKRLNANDYAADDVTVTHKFYDFNPASGSVLVDGGVKTYTLEPNSRHYAIPIPKTEIANGKGAIQQNTY